MSSAQDRLAQIADFTSRLRSVHSDDLIVLYQQRLEWARHYNTLIWTITSVMLPFALAGFALPFRNDKNDLLVLPLVFAAAGSVAIFYFWNKFADVQRRSWTREFLVAHAIEVHWKARSRPVTLDEAAAPLLHDRDIGQGMRHAFSRLGAYLWILRVAIELVVQATK